MNREKSLTGYLIGLNLLHVIVCFAVMLLRRYGIYDKLHLKWAALAIVLLLWFVFSYITALGSYMTKRSRAVGFGLLAVLPAAILAGACFGLSFIEGGDWLKFFFIGSSVNYFFRPMAALLRFLPQSAYFFYVICILILAVCSALGALMGIEASTKKVRAKNRRNPKKVSAPKKNAEKVDESSVSEAQLVEEKTSGKKNPKKERVSSRPEEDRDELVNAEIERLRKKLEEKKQSSDD